MHTRTHRVGADGARRSVALAATALAVLLSMLTLTPPADAGGGIRVTVTSTTIPEDCFDPQPMGLPPGVEVEIGDGVVHVSVAAVGNYLVFFDCNGDGLVDFTAYAPGLQVEQFTPIDPSLFHERPPFCEHCLIDPDTIAGWIENEFTDPAQWEAWVEQLIQLELGAGGVTEGLHELGYQGIIVDARVVVSQAGQPLVQVIRLLA